MSIQQQPQAKPADAIGFGIAMTAAGLYFMLGGWGVLPMPEGTTGTPLFIIVLAGAAFAFAGLSLIVRSRAGVRDGDSERPATAPDRAGTSYRIAALAIAGTLATIGTWIAIASGPRHFASSGPAPFGESVGRAVFALVAVIAWIYVIALTVGTVRKLFDRNGR